MSHTYSAGGNYTATLTVDDGHGGSNSASVAITVVGVRRSAGNGDFESSTPGSALGTGWIAFSSSGYTPTFAVVSDQVHGGSFAQRVTSPQPSSSDKFAGVYQVVATTPGVQYTVHAWNRTHFSGGAAWDHIARLGIDLNGGNDFQASSVQWLEFDSAKDAWHPLEVGGDGNRRLHDDLPRVVAQVGLGRRLVDLVRRRPGRAERPAAGRASAHGRGRRQSHERHRPAHRRFQRQRLQRPGRRPADVRLELRRRRAGLWCVRVPHLLGRAAATRPR